jgi:hypothetical protein
MNNNSIDVMMCAGSAVGHSNGVSLRVGRGPGISPEISVRVGGVQVEN